MGDGFLSTSTRRDFLVTAGAVAGAAAFSPASARAASKYRRYNVTSPEGQRALASYAKGVEAMLRLPPSHPHNWFRNAFVHLMDCPHGNWWFYVWHRGYLGLFERTIRELSGDESFAMPYWDWTQLPRIPDGLFDGVLTPVDKAFERYTGNLAIFTSFIKPALNAYWNSLSAAQRMQLNTRGYKVLDDLWNDVTGYSPAVKAGISGNMAYANTCGARYLSRSNPKLDPKTTHDVSPFIINSGIAARDFYNADNISESFNSSRTPSHNTAPSGATKFSILEGFPHNKVHNYIGGVGPIDPGPYGNMTNFLSPVDPIFFLHHSNMDRLWDVWTRKQKQQGRPYLPTGADFKTFAEEPFVFFVDGKGEYVTNGKAGDYLSTEVFGYDYQPGFGEPLVRGPQAALGVTHAAPIAATVHANTASVVVPRATLQGHLAGAARPLFVEITLPRPDGTATAREFDVLVNAPEGVTQVGADSPYYAGTIAFFGPVMHGMKMSTDATFAVPLPPTLHAFTALGAASSATLNVRVVPTHGGGSAPTLRALSVKAP